MISGLSEVVSVVFIVARVLVWLVLVREFRKERQMGEIVNVNKWTDVIHVYAHNVGRSWR